jgi:hypothetical protein
MSNTLKIGLLAGVAIVAGVLLRSERISDLKLSPNQGVNRSEPQSVPPTSPDSGKLRPNLSPTFSGQNGAENPNNGSQQPTLSTVADPDASMHKKQITAQIGSLRKTTQCPLFATPETDSSGRQINVTLVIFTKFYYPNRQ